MKPLVFALCLLFPFMLFPGCGMADPFKNEPVTIQAPETHVQKIDISLHTLCIKIDSLGEYYYKTGDKQYEKTALDNLDIIVSNYQAGDTTQRIAIVAGSKVKPEQIKFLMNKLQTLQINSFHLILEENF